jgi:hypothetical protein
VIRRLERAGFAVQSILGDYQGGPWDARADVWVIIAKKGRSRKAGTDRRRSRVGSVETQP